MSILNLDVYKFTLTGISPLLIHADIVEESDRLQAWRKDPKNKQSSVPGDDRSPPWTWQTYLYSDGEHLTMPSDNIMAALRKAGALVSLKGQTTFKSATQSGLLITEEHCPIVGPKGQVKVDAIHKFQDEPFGKHCEKAKSLGFTLYMKRAPIKKGGAKHVRVRPRFDDWSVTGRVQVSNPAITPDIIKQIFELAGANAGLGDWRPSSPQSPGPYGRFTVSIAKQ